MDIRDINISFPEDVELPDKWLNKLSALVDEVCHKYEEKNIDRVMWPAGGAFEDKAYYMTVWERADLYKKNPHRKKNLTNDK